MASKLGKLIWRTFRGAFRLFLAHPAAIMSAILAAIALGLGYRLWRVGLRAGLSSLLGLSVCLLLIIVILLARGKIRQWTQRRASERTAEVGKHIAKQAVREGAGRIVHQRRFQGKQEAAFCAGLACRRSHEKLP